jgi:hypothetical protein
LGNSYGTDMHFLENPKYLEKFINISEKVAREADFEQRKSQDLLKNI